MKKDSYCIVIPTRNGGSRLAAFSRAYRRLGVQPLYLLDSRTDDNSRSILRQENARFIEVDPEHDRGEDVLWRGAGATDAEWLLRIDDDEMPSAALIDWIEREGIHRREPVMYLSCRQAWHGGYSRSEAFYFNHSRPDFLMPQPRFFRPVTTRYTNALHTAGIEPDGAGWAPDTAFFLHFDWLVRDMATRVAKLRRYESQRPGGGQEFAHFSLPELQDFDRLRITALESDEFDLLLDEVALPYDPS
jgi:hypothetical protein